ncbi:malto-oligosyltrehalose synthase [Filimonas effusa]|uniref:Malto-oligosyltrehalose synthase n=1 Tax=Filimonas effusa TaxID=2508721 RepID=A0A4V1M9W5_9BACT|nr:malto-oligosyltrehalose synthase [Filimonas effusa]RXK83094.1 malto-oligosyltrehalose synthase [Filimonas effusa]
MNFPSSTYRVQLNSSFTFQHLLKILPYLHRLGISTIYASPVGTSVPGSTHGYDVTDPCQINPEIGTLEELKELSQQLKALGMSWLQDIVPNHMAFSSANKRLMDVLERGERSPYYNYFDINWGLYGKEHGGKVMLPVLGEDAAECFNKGEIKLAWQEEGVMIVYYEEQYPVAPGIYEYLLPVSQAVWRERVDRLYDDWAAPLEGWTAQKHVLIEAVREDAEVLAYVTQRLNEINSHPRELMKWVNCQCYELACWQKADTHMNYRRFFAVNALISLRMENPAVFEDYHQLLQELCKDQMIQGVRIDHIDGLCHPREYIERLRKLLGEDCYMIAEKILEYQEQLPGDWKLEGTSGYEFLSFVNQVLTSQDGALRLKDFYQRWVPGMPPYEDLVFEKKYEFLKAYLAGEWDMLTNYLESLQVLQGVSYSRERLRKALGVWMAALPVYRIYADSFPLPEAERQLVRRAFAIAAVKAPDCSEELEALETLFEGNGNPQRAANKIKFIMRLMQFTGPLAAKGVEDTVFYLYNPLISHNEVGDSPVRLGISIDAFHKKMADRLLNSRYSLNTTSTHDTKRGEDARLRINVLAEMAEEWTVLVQQWNRVNSTFCEEAGLMIKPSFNDEYFIYQSLIGSYPATGRHDETFYERSKAFIVKALREAKEYTTYTRINSSYEDACVRFINGIIDYPPFMESFVPFVQKVVAVASVYTLGQVVIKCTAPGIPDIYQGCELWDTSYVDPDNRRAVDYVHREQLMQLLEAKEGEGARAELLEWLMQERSTGVEKLFVTKEVLHFRKAHQELFLEGDYSPLTIVNAGKHVLAFARHWKGKWVLVVVPVDITQWTEARAGHALWDKLAIELPGGAPDVWRELFTGVTVHRENGLLPLAPYLDRFPVAVLEA